jgi:hypothetical protein
MMFSRLATLPRFVRDRHANRTRHALRAEGCRVVATAFENFVVLLADALEGATSLYMADAAGEVTNWFPIMTAPDLFEAEARLAETSEEQWRAMCLAHPPVSSDVLSAYVWGTPRVDMSSVRSSDATTFVCPAAMLRHVLVCAGIPVADRMHGRAPVRDLRRALDAARSSEFLDQVPTRVWGPLGWTRDDAREVLDRISLNANAIEDHGFAEVAWTSGV